MNDILLNIVNIRMAIMICIGVILVREIYLVLNGYIAKAAYVVSAKLDFLPLKDGKISVSSAQLFGLNANIYKQDAKSPMNIQFVLDSLASKDTTRHSPTLQLYNFTTSPLSHYQII
jgi:hypothetical protein